MKKKVHLFLRLGLGTMLVIFGANKFIWFLADFDFTGFPEAQHLFDTLRYSGHDPLGGKGYIMHMVGAVEALIGLLLLLNKWVPFALLMLVPISVNIVMFHFMVNLPNLAPAALVALANGYLIYLHWDAYRRLFSHRRGDVSSA